MNDYVLFNTFSSVKTRKNGVVFDNYK